MPVLKKIIVLFLILAFSSVYAIETTQIQVKSNFTNGWGYQGTKILNLINGYKQTTDGRDDFTHYGTYKYLRTDSTGFFYTKKIDGRWWMVDPNGYAGINMGVCSLGANSIQNDYDRILGLGYNGIGNFLTSESQTKTSYNTQNYATFSYTRRLNFYLNYVSVRKNYYTTPSAVQGDLTYVFVFDPQFTTYCDNLANTNAKPFVNDRDLLGYFTDNEINFNQDQLQLLVRDLPAGDPSRDSALVFAASRGLTANDCINYTANVTEQMKQDFATQMANHYYRIVSAAIRKYDPNHLLLGSRLNGRPRAIQNVVNASEKYMDVTSVNFYDKYNPDEQISYVNWTNDKPCLVTEFYIKDVNFSLTTAQSGAGWYVNSQPDRGKFYQNTCLQLLKNKCYIGWQYFKYQDDTDSNKGIISGGGSEYTAMTAYMDSLNEQVYRLCDFYDGKTRRPVFGTKTKILEVSEDTYVIPGATSTTTYGTTADLEVRNYSLESYRREAFFKFKLGALKDSIQYLKHAELDLTCTVSDATVRSVFVTGLMDNSWSEQTLNGALRNANTDWSNGYNRLASVKTAVSTGLNTFDVSTWVNDMAKGGTISFKVMDLINTTAAIKFASRRNSDPAKTPKLILTFYDPKLTDVQQLKSNSENRLSQNPASGMVTITGNDLTSVELLNLNGQVIYKTTQNRIELSSYSKGIYLIRIKTSDFKTIVNKLVIK